ncbi:PhoH family protein [Vulgatibacter sp.]|uniref:PhoH family protein n=1 Tax=Vulgatibacter sp. TaxID=1971226 RepID=UPI0035630CD7
MAEATYRVELDDTALVQTLAGAHNEHLKLLERRTGARISNRGTTFTVVGDEPQAQLAERVLRELYGLLRAGYPLYPEDVEQAAKVLSARKDVSLKEIFLDTVYISSRNRVVAPKGLGQKRYIDAIRSHDITFGIGPAGTGKTYLAMAMAVAALAERKVKRIVLCRPAVEAGERLGFLPGDIAEKVNPYLRPLYDALNDMMDLEKAAGLIEKGTVEVAPLAFMRGRTLNDSFVILDEAQNTTPEQMKMFLTRLGFGSKAVITGDITQVDLPSGRTSGLADASEVLTDVEGIAFCRFTEVDVVRHPLVQQVVLAYEASDARKAARKAADAWARKERERARDGEEAASAAE